MLFRSLARHRRRKRSGWWSWSEQDRCLVAQWHRGRVVTLNAGAAPTNADIDIARAVDIEAARHGVLQELDVVHAGWHAGAGKPSADPRLFRAGVAASVATSQAHAAATTRHAGVA